MTIWTCPRGDCGADLEGSILEELWCPREGAVIPDYELEVG